MIAKTHRLPAVFSLMAVLTACGGGGDSGSSAPAASPAPATVVSGSPAPAPAPAAAGGSSCGLSEEYFTIGTRLQVDLRNYAADGRTISSNIVNNSVNTRLSTFAGASVIENENNMVTTEVSGAQAGVPQASVIKTYSNRDSSDTLSYGTDTSATRTNGTSTSTINFIVSFAPPLRRPLNPALNTTYSSSTTVTNVINGAPTPPVAFTTTFTPLAFENITVPAGTFPVCKYTSGAATALSTEYSIATGACRGLVVRSLNSSGVITSEVTSARINGAACL